MPCSTFLQFPNVPMHFKVNITAKANYFLSIIDDFKYVYSGIANYYGI